MSMIDLFIRCNNMSMIKLFTRDIISLKLENLRLKKELQDCRLDLKTVTSSNSLIYEELLERSAERNSITSELEKVNADLCRLRELHQKLYSDSQKFITRDAERVDNICLCKNSKRIKSTAGPASHPYMCGDCGNWGAHES